MRLIDADELTEMVWRERVDTRERIANLIARQPTIEGSVKRCKMNPAKRGEWLVKVIIPIENFELKGLNIIRARCTVCLIFSSDITSKTEMTLPYCPNCGADMTGGDT